jgi:hypothetical protein
MNWQPNKKGVTLRTKFKGQRLARGVRMDALALGEPLHRHLNVVCREEFFYESTVIRPHLSVTS